MRLLKRVLLLAVMFTFAVILLVRISDLKPEEYVHPAGRVARAVRLGITENSGAEVLENTLSAVNSTRLRHTHIIEVCFHDTDFNVKTAD